MKKREAETIFVVVKNFRLNMQILVYNKYTLFILITSIQIINIQIISIHYLNYEK